MCWSASTSSKNRSTSTSIFAFWTDRKFELELSTSIGITSRCLLHTNSSKYPLSTAYAHSKVVPCFQKWKEDFESLQLFPAKTLRDYQTKIIDVYLNHVSKDDSIGGGLW